MKALVILSALLIAPMISAAASKELVCDLNLEKTVLKAKVKDGALVQVKAHEMINGYVWMTSEGERFEVLEPAQIGGANTVGYTIDTSKQERKTQTYVFRNKRSWEPDRATDTICQLTITLK